MTARKILAVSTAAMMALTLASCSGNDDEGAAPTAPDGEVSGSITYWASNQGTSNDHDREVLEPILQAFTDETGVEVELEVISWTDLQTRIQTAVTSGQAPDVVNIGNTWAVSLQATGAFLEFGDAEMEAVGGADKFVASALETGGQAGSAPASLPLYGLAYGLYYNRQMFEDAGLEPPATWEEMVAAAEQLTNPDEGVYGLTVAGGSYRMNAHLAFITSSQNGAELFAEDGTPDFAKDEVADGILRYVNLMQESGAINPSDSQLDSAAKSMPNFAAGQAAMTIQQSNAAAVFLANGMERSEFGVVPLPAPADAAAETGSHVAGINIAVFENTDNKDAALAFVNHMTSEQVQTEVGEPFSVIPVLTGHEPTFTDDEEEAATFMEVYQNRSKPLPLVPAEDQYEQTVGNAMNQMFATAATGGNVTKEDILAALTTAQESIR